MKIKIKIWPLVALLTKGSFFSSFLERDFEISLENVILIYQLFENRNIG
ncbi:MAG: hypothetical protein AAB565_00835 [Patescibacteria group bacterium]